MKGRLNTLLIVLLFITSYNAYGQEKEPQTELLQAYEEVKARADTIHFVAEQFALGSYEVRDLGDRFQQWAREIATRMEENPHLEAYFFGYHNHKEWTEWVKRTAPAYMQQGDVNDRLNTFVAESRAFAAARTLVEDFGVDPFRVKTRPVLRPHKRRTVSIVLVDTRGEAAKVLSSIQGRFVRIEAQLDSLLQRQEDLELRLAANENIDSRQDERLDDLERRVRDIEENLPEQNQFSFVVGGGISGSDFPAGFENNRSYVLEGALGLAWERYFFLEISYGISPFTNSLDLPDGRTKLRKYSFTLTGSLYPYPDIVPVGGLIGINRSQDRAVDFGEFVSQKDSWILGLEFRYKFLKLDMSWAPGEVEVWNRKRVRAENSSVRVGLGIFFHLGN